MGFTPLEGVPDGDPGRLGRPRGAPLPARAPPDARGASTGCSSTSRARRPLGPSGDVRELESSNAPAARLALAVFTYRVATAVGAMATALGGLDALVFTAGIGENSASVRAAVCGGSASSASKSTPRPTLPRGAGRNHRGCQHIRPSHRARGPRGRRGSPRRAARLLELFRRCRRRRCRRDPASAGTRRRRPIRSGSTRKPLPRPAAA